MTFASSLTDLTSVNSSFDQGVLRVAYTGENHNKSFISKEAFEKSINTMFNCPIVCNYDRDTDTLGGHDMEVVRDEDGGLRIVNVTTPLGVIPESANYWWDTVTEDDGAEHEYLFVEALLWKRQEAYSKVKRDGITAHSMEITVKDGEMVDGIFHINDFEFTAFALIGVAPCFESSAIELFSKQDFKEQMSKMMQDLKETFALVNTSTEVDDINTQQTEGGEKVLQEKIELAEKFGIDIDTLDFCLDDFSVEELTAKFEAIANAEQEPVAEEPAEPEAGEPEVFASDEPAQEPEPEQDTFALNNNVVEEIMRGLHDVKVEREWGICDRYLYVDCDMDANEVYCWDTNDWLLYGFTYSANGDAITIDFESKKRKKYVIEDFDAGEQPSPFAPVFEQLEAEYQAASEKVTAMETELGELRQFKQDADEKAAKQARDEIFAKFEDLVGVEAFDALKQNCDLDADALEEKCYAIRGRNNTVAKFSLEKTPKMKVVKEKISDEPYGGLFAEYGYDFND